ncbi:hypothetical protein PGT21_023779 [Puccinia graminis f. sp. tritici]|uniref:Uncharacterized protein n=1 Tax=Puccinia graminis f. sp. tritici TaxID=56615 RepID=A0A5B0Q6N0_PUCGR|nr:hypothetical protein PGT21_023779 [Puccinia graminis f. sp. tritici]
MFPEMVSKGAQGLHRSSQDFYQLASFPTDPTSLTSFFPSNDLPSHSFLRKEMFFTPEKEHSNEPTPESMFESMPQREMGPEDDDLKISRLFKQLQSPEFASFAAQKSSSLSDHVQVLSKFPQPKPDAEKCQAHFQDHPPIQYRPHAGKGHEVHHSEEQAKEHPRNQGPQALGSSHAHSRSESSQSNENRRFSSKESLEEDQAEDPNESLQAHDADQSENVDVTTRSIIPKKPGFLSKSMDDEVLGNFTKKFKHYVLEILKHAYKTKNQNDYPIEGLPTRISKTNGLYIIRVGIDHQLPTSNPSRGNIQKTTKLFALFVDLIEWLLFTNSAVLRQSDLTKKINKPELDSHHQLINFLFQEAFHPRNSAPVIGMISSDALHGFGRGNEFGPIQRILIRCLSSLQQSDRTRQAAFSIVRFYYKEFKPEIYQGLGGLNQEDFDLKINSLIAEAVRSQMIVGRGSDVVGAQRNLENFAICDLEIIPYSMKPKSHRVMYNVGLGKKEREIIKHYREVFSKTRPKFREFELLQTQVESEEFPARLRSLSFNDKETRLDGYVWIETKAGDLARTDYIQIKLESLIVHLKVCHSEFLQYINHCGIQTESDLEQKFFQWIYDIFINPGNGKLPIFGNFVLKNQTKSNFLLSKSHFYPTQIYLMHYFSDTRTYDRTIHVGLTLIGYWYKNKKHDYFDNLFKNDRAYWKTVIGLLKEKYYYAGFCSLRNFSKDETL